MRTVFFPEGRACSYDNLEGIRGDGEYCCYSISIFGVIKKIIQRFDAGDDWVYTSSDF
jgi:hypothetical protein